VDNVASGFSERKTIMVDLIEFRVSTLVRRSDHYRRLVDGLLPTAISAEVAAVADECDREVARMECECRGKKSCPCRCFATCFRVD